MLLLGVVACLGLVLASWTAVRVMEALFAGADFVSEGGERGAGVDDVESSSSAGSSSFSTGASLDSSV